jgi:hypothetical protein
VASGDHREAAARRHARRGGGALAVLVLSAYVEQAFATDLLAGGAARLGYLLKERVGRVAQFLDALHRVAGVGTAIDPEVVAQLLSRSRPDTALDRLTARERDVLALMAEGLGNTASTAGRIHLARYIRDPAENQQVSTLNRDSGAHRHRFRNDLHCPMVADMISLFAAALLGRTRRMARC